MSTTEQEQVAGHMRELRRMLDVSTAYPLLNDPRMRAAMKSFVRAAGSGTRPELAAQVFAFGVELERQRVGAMLRLGTWPCHDHPPPDEGLAELIARSQQA